MTSPWAAIVGWSKEGRNEATRRVVDELRRRGVDVSGCLQERLIEEGTNEIVGYDLVDLGDGRRHELARPSGDPVLCNWAFDEKVFESVRERVLDDASPVVLFEVGPLEARGIGHWPAIQRLLASPGRLVLLGIRPRALARIALELPDPVAGLEVPAQPGELEEFIDTIASGRTRSP